MKSCVVALLCACSLAACGKQASPNAIFSKSSDPLRTGATAVPSCSPLPAKVVLDFPHHLQSDYYYVNVNKAIRRSVVMLYLRDDTATVDRHVRGAMLAAGFSFHDSKPEGQGRTHLRFRLKGYGMAHVTLQPMAEATDDGDAIVKGTMTFDLPPPQFNPPPKTK